MNKLQQLYLEFISRIQYYKQQKDNRKLNDKYWKLRIEEDQLEEEYYRIQEEKSRSTYT